jgi:hypothetical protein
MKCLFHSYSYLTYLNIIFYNPNNSSLQVRVIQVMCLLVEDKECLNEAFKMYETWKINKSEYINITFSDNFKNKIFII